MIRIEDTDKARSNIKFEEEIKESLTWLDLLWEEKIVKQSERLPIYEKHLEKLIKSNDAYYCFCSTEELELERQAQLTQGLVPRYSGKCRSLSSEEVSKRIPKESAVIRLRVPEKSVSFTDTIRGKVSFDVGLMGDFIIAKTIRDPLYNFAAAIDDAEMKITHVIRGEDHLANTPKQILIQEVLGFEQPRYAHLPLILGPDRKKLSKRYLASSVLDYRRNGYLPNAMLNFLVLLGWHPEKDREVLTREEMIAEFGLKRVQKGGAVFNPEKLDWLNANMIKTISVKTLAECVTPFVPAPWLAKKHFFENVLLVIRDRIKKLSDIQQLASFFFIVPSYEKKLLVWRGGTMEKTREILEEIVGVIESIPAKQFSDQALEDSFIELIGARGKGDILWPLRVALSGQEASPPPFSIANVLGKEETLRRVNLALDMLDGGEISALVS